MREVLPHPVRENAGGTSQEDAKGIGSVTPISGISANEWFSIAHWAKENGYLSSFQRSLAFSLGVLASRGRSASEKQIKYGVEVLKEARRLGFKIDE